MKLKKLVSALVSGAMILGTMAAVPAFADDDVFVKEPEVIDIEPVFDETDVAGQNVMMLSDADTATTENVTEVSTQEGLAEALADADVTSISLLNSIEMTGKWTPADISRDLTINGNGYTISNMVVVEGLLRPSGSGVAGDGGSCDYRAGFIGNNTGNLTINDLKFSNANVDMHPLSEDLNSTGSSQLAVVLGVNNGGDAVFNNVEVYGSVVKGYTKVGCLVGHAQAGTVTLNKCALDSNTVVLEGDGTDKWAAFSGVIAGYDPERRIATNGIKLAGNQNIIDRSCNFGTDEIIRGDGIVTCASYGLTCDTYATGSYANSPVRFVASVNDYQYTTHYNATSNANAGDTVKLLRDMENTPNMIYITKDLTLDLNGKTFRSSNTNAAVYVYGGNLTIVDGSDSQTGAIIDTKTDAVWVAKGSMKLKSGTLECTTTGSSAVYCSNGTSMEMDGGTVISLYYGIAAMADTNLTINAGTVTATVGYAVTGNGTSHNSTLTINGGIISGEEQGIYHPQNGKLFVNGGTITGGCTGIELRAGEAVINGGIITGNGTPTDSDPNGNGATTNGAGIAVAQHTTKLPTSLTVNGGTISGFTAIFQKNIENNPADAVEKVSLKLTGGKYKVINGGSAAVFSENKTGFISGGTFDAGIADYVADGYYQKKNDDNTYTVLPVEAKIIDTAKTTGATVTLDNLHKNTVVNPADDATYKVVVETAPAADAKKANDAIKANADTNTSKAMFDISVKKIDSNGVETDLSDLGENSIKNQPVTLTLGETPSNPDAVRVYHVDDTEVTEIKRDNIDKLTVSGNKVSFIAPSFSTYAVTYNADPLSDRYIANEVSVAFDRVGDTNEYDIVLKGKENKKINRFMSADLTFDMKVTNGVVGYTIKPSTNINIVDNGNGRYEFNLDGLNASGATGNEVPIGKVIFDGNGTVIFRVKTEGVTTNIVNTAKSTADNIVDDYIPGGRIVGSQLVGNLYLDSSSINPTFTAPTKDLTVNIAYNNKIADNAAAYQDMTVTISGGDLTTPIVKNLGREGYTLTDNKYTVTVANELTQNTSYTVTVEGAGYRTARYTVNMATNKTLNFWNNVKDADEVIEVGKDSSKTTKNFLAGDIVKDNQINIYDLSAVVSYFGTSNVVTAESAYARYDLNRDGVIDSKDVAYVLVSWGE